VLILLGGMCSSEITRVSLTLAYIGSAQLPLVGPPNAALPPSLEPSLETLLESHIKELSLYSSFSSVVSTVMSRVLGVI
jgi:hypothetical protein